jgi:hypothetical protein
VSGRTVTLMEEFEAASAHVGGSLNRIRQLWPREPPMVRARRVRAFLADAVSLLEPLAGRVEDLAGHAVGGVAAAAAVAAAEDLATVGRRFTAVDAVVELAAKQLAGDLHAAVDHYLLTARSLARELLRAASSTGTAREMEVALERTLRDRGLAAVVYRDGSRHGLAEYSRMAARTALAETWQRATFAAMRDVGAGWVEIVDGAGCGWTRHDDPDKANGSIRSVDDAESYPLAHPNCGRTAYPRRDITGAADALQARVSRVVIPDRPGALPPAVRTRSGTLDTRALAVLAPAAARHASRMARLEARNVTAEGHAAAVQTQAALATLRGVRTRTPGPGGRS